MPNFKQSLKLKSKYIHHNEISSSDQQMILEGFNPDRINKGFYRDGNYREIKNFSFSHQVIKYFEKTFSERKKEEVVLLFIDITSFSTKFKNKSPNEVATFLDQYYDKVIPKIYYYNGEIEKIMGDGIICVFGKPFLDLGPADLHRKAEECAMKIITELKGTDFESKIAFHYGEIMYYQNKTQEYYEYTMIGNSITELFRLESISHPNSINFYSDTYFDFLKRSDVEQSRVRNISNAPWTLFLPEKIDLKGVNYTYFRKLQKN